MSFAVLSTYLQTMRMFPRFQDSLIPCASCILMPSAQVGEAALEKFYRVMYSEFDHIEGLRCHVVTVDALTQKFVFIA